MNASAFLRASLTAAAALLAALGTAPAAAQGASARMTASATVVERVSFAAGPSRVAFDRGGHIDVTTPLALQGRAAIVVHVLEGEPGAAPASSPLRPAPTTPAGSTTGTGYTTRLRLPRPPGTGAGNTKASLTYVISTVN
ncbi:MAG TPA: hypothetical protein VF746_04285 [Longimicrobium sp.]|jgi:hypothetical protein